MLMFCYNINMTRNGEFPANIFLFEDRDDTANIATLLLSGHGFTIRRHIDTEEAIKHLEEVSQRTKDSPYAVYVLDGNTTPGNKHGQDGKLVYEWLEAKGFEDRVIGFSSLPFREIIGHSFPSERDINNKDIGKMVLLAIDIANIR